MRWRGHGFEPYLNDRHNCSEGGAVVVILVATDREVVVIDVERGQARQRTGSMVTPHA
jgi:hypothetical protein